MDLKQLIYILSRILFCTGLISSDYYEDDNNDHESCICVPYWQCKEDFSGLLQDGVEIMDVRVFRRSGGDSADGPCTGDFDVCCRIECGRRNLGVTIEYEDNDIADVQAMVPRITGGEDAEFAEFPWMLAIMEDKVYRCGASLIHPQVAVTAAHCVDDSGLYKVRAGEWNWKSSEEALPHQDRLAKKVITHPLYNPQALINDIALLILDTPFKLAENVGIVCLPPPGLRHDNTKCTTSGWGKSSRKKGTYQSILKKIDVPLVPRSKCLKSLRNARLGPQFHLHRSFICAGGGSRDACKGDGGSPLFCEVEGERGRYEQVGIVSWGLTCGVFETPGVYVNVGLFSEWIDGEMGGHGFDTNIYRY